MRPRTARKPPESFFELVEAWAKLGLPLLGLLYVFGFVVDALYLGKYGVSPLGFVRAQYLLAGVWAMVPMAILASAIALIGWAIFQQAASRELDERRVPAQAAEDDGKFAAIRRKLRAYRETRFGRFLESLESLREIVMMLVGLVVIMGVTLRWVSAQFPNREPLTGRQLWSFVPPVLGYAFGITIGAALSVNGFRREGFRRLVETVSGLALTILVLFGYLGYFSAVVYPRIPSVMGGGQPVSVRFLVKAPVKGVAESTPYDVLVSSEKTIVILVDGEAREYSRDLFDAIVDERVAPPAKRPPR